MLINRNDFECVGEVAVHCDLKKLCVAIEESRIADMENLFCDFWFQIEDIIKEVDDYLSCLKDQTEEEPIECIEPENYEVKYNLVYGGVYENCSGTKLKHLGIKKIWAYYAYGRYLLINATNDTPIGQQKKTGDFSMPVDMPLLKANSEKYRNLGYESFKKVLGFLCLNKEIFDFNHSECKSCGCAGGCNSKTKVKGFGIKLRTITRD